MRGGAIVALLVVAILAGAGAGYFIGSTSQRQTTLVSTTTLPATQVSSNVFVMNVNGSFYYADDISSDVVVQNPGYAYFKNASVTFDGIKFETFCPQSISGCPMPAGNRTIQTVTAVMIGLFKFNMTFPDGSTETAGNVIGTLSYTFALSQHTNPRAGMLIEYVEYNPPNNYPSYHTFLLVSPCGLFGCDISTTTVHSGQTP